MMAGEIDEISKLLGTLEARLKSLGRSIDDLRGELRETRQELADIKPIVHDVHGLKPTVETLFQAHLRNKGKLALARAFWIGGPSLGIGALVSWLLNRGGAP